METYLPKILSYAEQHWKALLMLSVLMYCLIGAAIDSTPSGKNKKLIKKLKALQAEYAELQARYNYLVNSINGRGGMSAFREPSAQFSPEEIKHLVMLCHPDKHGGSTIANDITAKLLSIR